MATFDLICSHYDSGRRDWRMGRGPRAILEAGAVGALERQGHTTRIIEIEPAGAVHEAENAVSFAVLREIASAVADARSAGHIPLVLSGNCNCAVAGASGIGGRRGLVWFDAHGDFCTPETTRSGFLDGMGLALMVGRCWQGMAAQIPGYQPLPEDLAALVGARDFDPLEARDLEASAITAVPVETIRQMGATAALAPFLASLEDRIDHLYVHIDLDVHDPEEAPANFLLTPDGLTPDEVTESLGAILNSRPVAGLGLASYQPEVDPTGATAAAAVRLIELLGSAMSEA